MCKTRLHRIRYGTPGDWQFRLKCGIPAYGFYLTLGIWSYGYLRPLVCAVLGHRAGKYSLLEEYQDMVDVCVRCSRVYQTV